jgi:hypothetical protein
MWNQFSHLGPIEHFTFDSTEIDPEATAVLIRERMTHPDRLQE